jgi:O-antigen/teichoic acid export membrane protein
VLFGSMLSLSAVGDFELGYRVVVALWSVPWWLLPPLLPAAAHLDAVGDRERIVRLYRRASRYVLAAAFPIAAGVVTLAPALYDAWLGPGHANAARAATALAAMLGVNILTGVGTAIARGIGRPGFEARYQIAAILLHLAGSLLLIPRFGFTGGLWALFVSTSVASLYFVWSFHRFLGESLARFAREVVAPPLASAVVAGLGTAALARLIPGGPLVRFGAEAAAFAAIAGALLLATRSIGLGEIRDMTALVAGRPAGVTAGEGAA